MSKHDLKARQLQVEQIICPVAQPIRVRDLLRYEEAQTYETLRDIPDIEKVQSLIGEAVGPGTVLSINIIDGQPVTMVYGTLRGPIVSEINYVDNVGSPNNTPNFSYNRSDGNLTLWPASDISEFIIY